jgi:hypothetical protein
MIDNFLRSADCGVTDWTDLTDIGFPESQHIIEVDGVLGAIQPMGCCCWNDNTTPIASWTSAWQNEAACLNNPTHYDAIWHCLTPCEELDPECGKGACCYDNVSNPDQRLCTDNITEADCLGTYAGLRPHLILGINCEPGLDCAPIPDNDNCTSAETLTGYCVDVTFNSANASSDFYPNETDDGASYIGCLDDGGTPVIGYAPPI